MKIANKLPVKSISFVSENESSEKGLFVILSEAKDLVFRRFFGRFAPSE